MTSLTPVEELVRVVGDARRGGSKVTFTNGCFDILHRGHVEYLAEAATLGDILIVGLNDDASVSRLKGAGRPVNPLEDRAVVLKAVRHVDYVVAFKEDTPIDLIRVLNPDVLVKGGDYRIEEIVGREHVESSGGQVIVLKEVKGKSTTGILRALGSGRPDPS